MTVVGIQIEGSRKIYYYLTSKNYRIGQKIKIKAPSGGTPDATVVRVNCVGTFGKLRELMEV